MLTSMPLGNVRKCLKAFDFRSVGLKQAGESRSCLSLSNPLYLDQPLMLEPMGEVVLLAVVTTPKCRAQRDSPSLAIFSEFEDLPQTGGNLTLVLTLAPVELGVREALLRLFD